LIHEVLYRNLVVAKRESSEHQPTQSYGFQGDPGACKAVTGAQRIRDVIMVDQAPLARTPRSTPLL
jgi:excinuclease ABC subunit A